MSKIVIVCLTVLLTITIPVLATAEEPDAGKAATIREIMALGEIDDLANSYGRNMADQLYQVLKTSRPEIPAEAMAIIREEVDKQLAADREQLLAKIVAIFDQSFTAEELQELRGFYQTDLGKKSLALMPKIMQENMEIGRSWGKEVGPALRARLEARFKPAAPSVGK
jgi:hypothetical protein